MSSDLLRPKKKKMMIKTLTLGPMSNNTYIIGSESAGECIVIDPGWDMTVIGKAIKTLGLKPLFVLLTHGHFDHCKNINSLLGTFDLKVFIHKDDVFMLEDVDKSRIKTFDADYVFNIKSFPIGVICTPGHTPGSCCYLIENNLFTGDTLFVGQCGRVDFPYSSPEQMNESLVKLSKLDPDTKVLPGHMPETSTIAREIKTNPYIKLAIEETSENP